MIIQTLTVILLVLVIALASVVLIKELDGLLNKIFIKRRISKMAKGMNNLKQTLEAINKELEPKTTRKRKTKDE